MKESDNKLLKDSTLNTVDVIVSNIPWLNIARWLSKALIFNWLAMRQDRVLEFVEFIINQPWYFAKDLMKTEEFQDWFVYCIEKYIRERNKDKRLIAQRIFLWFATSKEKEQFELERYLNVLNLLWSENLEHLWNIRYSLLSHNKDNNKGEFVIDSSYARWMEGKQQYLNDLISLWIVYSEYSEERRDEKLQWVWVEYKVTKFWHKFLEFLIE